jgi:predicted branched-subunit amino acid permease
MNMRPVLTIRGVVRGAWQTLPLVLGMIPIGIVIGVLSRQAGLTWLETVLMSALAFSASAQLLALQLWIHPLPVLGIAAGVILVNARYVLQAATLHEPLRGWSRTGIYGSLFLLTDGTWAATLREFSHGVRDPGFLVGSGLIMYSGWVAITAFGHVLGLAPGADWKPVFDFLAFALFAALLPGLWRDRSDALPWIIAGGVSVIAARWLPGHWYILLGGLAGGIAGMLADPEKRRTGNRETAEP